ncbi:MAG: hypothetical protein ACRAVC_07150 [Trichormus sp.]
MTAAARVFILNPGLDSWGLLLCPSQIKIIKGEIDNYFEEVKPTWVEH